jgi:hypothetical protein
MYLKANLLFLVAIYTFGCMALLNEHILLKKRGGVQACSILKKIVWYTKILLHSGTLPSCFDRCGYSW